MLSNYCKILVIASALSILISNNLHASDSKSIQEELLSQLNQKHNELNELERQKTDRIHFAASALRLETFLDYLKITNAKLAPAKGDKSNGV